MKHKNFHPEICKLLDEILELETCAQLRANNLLEDNDTRIKAQAAVNSYAYFRMRLRELNMQTLGIMAITTGFGPVERGSIPLGFTNFE